MENYQDPLFSFPNQLTPLDTFWTSCDYAVWNYPEIGFQETADLISLLDMVLSDPYYEPNFSLLQDGFIHDPIDECGVLNEITEGYNGHEQVQINEQEKASSENTTYNSKKRSRMDSNPKRLSRETISQYFYMPIAEAAKAMKVGLTFLKKRCRELGIRRWPRRKLMSLQTLINNVQEMKKEGVSDALKILEREKKLLEEIPDMELKGETKRLRQACFKSNFKKRKLIEVEQKKDINSSPSSKLKLLKQVLFVAIPLMMGRNLCPFFVIPS